MNAYHRWNDALAERFFNRDHAGRNVHLYVNRDLINDMEAAMPDAGTFRRAVAGSPLWLYGEGVCQRALQAFYDWRDKGWLFPPYIGYLSFFVLASDIDGDYSPNAYYPRLWELLTGEQRYGRVPSFHRMRLLWQDLETWSMDDCNGELGQFQAREVRRYVHVGYPISQSLLVEQERRALPWIFYDADLDPATHHSPRELARALRRPFAKQLLRAKTVRLAENPNDPSDLHNAMLEAVANELAEWDGSSPEPVLGNQDLRPVLLGLRICIEHLDRITGIAKVSLRCKLNQRRRDFPEEGIAIERGFEAVEAWNGWSLPVRRTGTDEILDASNLDWLNGTILRTAKSGWRLKLQAREVRIFSSGLTEGISGFVESHILPQGSQFLLSYPVSVWPRLERWATTQCRGFQQIDITQGLPEGWRLAEFQEAISDEGVRDEFPGLSFSRNARLHFVGGIRSEIGNKFFDFAPPSVVLSGSVKSTVVYCNEKPLAFPENGGVVDLPANLPIESRITLVAREGPTSLDRLSLFLTGDFKLTHEEPEYSLDSSGATQYGPRIPATTGALVKGLTGQPTLAAAEIFEDLVYEMGGMQGYLIGQQPGQIVAWPSESFPIEWTPVWVVRKSGKRMASAFVGEALDGIPASGSTAPVPPRRRVQDWKQVLWHWRRRVLPPPSPSQRASWRQLQEVARIVR